MKKTILIVDDDSKVKQAVKAALEKGDFKVVEASNGLECLQKLHDGLKPKLIILDAAMPVMSGWRTLYEMHKDPKLEKIKAVLFTNKESHCKEKDKAYCKELDGHYIAKPFTAKEILKKVRQLTAS
ncbi:MAG: response regulator [Candidatus Diapherotrites archaeon]|nr:response regulator [Candidatus Diapherotrites archaeon]